MYVSSVKATSSVFKHRRDPVVADKPLGVIGVLREDELGAAYEVRLLDTSYNRDLVPGLPAGVTGRASGSASGDSTSTTRRPPRTTTRLVYRNAVSRTPASSSSAPGRCRLRRRD